MQFSMERASKAAFTGNAAVKSSTSRQLADRIARRDPRAEEEFVLRYRAGLLNALRRRTGGGSDAEDLLQDAFVIALRRLRQGTIQQPERLSGFMFGLARNLAIERARKEQKAQAETGDEWVSLIPDGRPGQLSELLQREKARIVRQVLSKLRLERDRQILFRYYIEGEDKEQIRLDLQLSSLHFNRVLHRARRRYRKLYQQMASACAA